MQDRPFIGLYMATGRPKVGNFGSKSSYNPTSPIEILDGGRASLNSLGLNPQGLVLRALSWNSRTHSLPRTLLFWENTYLIYHQRIFRYQFFVSTVVWNLLKVHISEKTRAYRLLFVDLIYLRHLRMECKLVCSGSENDPGNAPEWRCLQPYGRKTVYPNRLVQSWSSDSCTFGDIWRCYPDTTRENCVSIHG